MPVEPAGTLRQNLTPEEWAVGFRRPPRFYARHSTCGLIFPIGKGVVVAFAQDASARTTMWCTHDDAMHPVSEFVWASYDGVASAEAVTTGPTNVLKLNGQPLFVNGATLRIG